MKKIAIILAALMFVFALTSGSHAGLLKSTIPAGKEIKDPYLEKLFAPEFPYESVKVLETKDGKRYVIVKAKEMITDEIRRNYEDETLFNRKITIYRSGNPHTGSLLVAEMRLHRIASEKPFIVEYSKVENEKVDPFPGSIAEDVLRRSGQYLIIRINKDFGKAFKKVEIYPEKDANCLEPPFVGKYPNSRSIACTEYKNKKGITFTYVSKDKTEDIYNYYRGKLKAHYNKIGFNFPENFWASSGVVDNTGIQINPIQVDQWGKTLDYLIKGKPIKSPPPL